MSINIFENKKLIIFDLDGTMIDSIGIWNEVDVELITYLGGVPDDMIGERRADVLRERNQGNIYLNYAEYLKERYNSDLSKEEILEKRMSIANYYLINVTEAKPDVEKALLLLMEKGYDIALATATTRWNVDTYFNKNKNISSKIDLLKTFKFVITKDDITNQKPDPEIFLKCAEHFKVQPSDCLVIEDSLVGVLAGKNAGMEVVCMYDKYSEMDKEEIKRIADVFVNDYNEFIDLID